MPDQRTICAILIVAALLAGLFEAIKGIKQIGWRNMNREERISIALYPIIVPLAIFVGIFWGFVALVAASVSSIIKAFAGIRKKIVHQIRNSNTAAW
jgi:hypothetical protein